MKKIRNLFLILVASFIFAGFGVKAIVWQQNFVDIRIPALRGIWKSSYYTKSDNSWYQYLYVLDSKNLTMTETRSIEARTVSSAGNTIWKNAIIGGTINWGDANAMPLLSYQLQIRTKENHITNTRVWANWSW